MARKGNQQKNGLDRHSFNHKRKVSDSGHGVPDTKGRGQTAEVKTVPGEELPLPNGNQASNPLTETANKTSSAGDEKKIKQRSGRSLRKDKQEMGTTHGLDNSVPRGSDPRESAGNVLMSETCGIREENATSLRTNSGSKHPSDSSGCSPNGLPSENPMKNFEFSDILVVRSLRASALSILKAANEWLERQKPFFISLSTRILNVRDLIRMKIEQTYPIILKWLMHFGNIMLLLSMVWLDCTIRGIDSFLRMGTTSFFSVIWCSIFSVFAMIGMSKFLIILIISVLMGVFRGFALASLVIAISGVVILWIYGSFWITALIIFCGGLAFTLKHERVALLLTTIYSVYCAWAYVGWLGLIVALNLSFISSDALIYLLKNSANEHRRSSIPPEQTDGVRGRSGFFSGEQPHASSSEAGSEQAPDRRAGVTSTSGADSEITSEEEVVRLLNCTDHYSALGLSRFENIDVSLLKREYRKKAMLVHPDKNMGNERAAEAFKKLQNAYEVLLDSLKRKAYDDELRREELLNCFRRFQTASQKNGRHGPFTSGFTRSESEVEDPFGESRRIACKKCGNFHVWVHTKKSKSQARWCQDCKDFHQAKDGDGWVEQSTQPFFFGILQKVDAPSAFVCAESRIYDATEWYICQGMRCPANTHKPSFHVNTSVTSGSKHNGSKGTSSGQKGGMPPPNMEENMTEEEFFEWLQNAVQAGMFDTGGGSTSAESPSGKAGNFSKSGTNSGSKRKKKGKKQW